MSGATPATPAVSQDDVGRVAEAIENARCKGREGPFGGYDYGYNPEFYGPPPEGGRYVIRDFRDPASPDWGKWLHQTDDKDEHEALFEKMTREHYARAAIATLQPQPSVVEALNDTLDLIDELYRKYGVELDEADVRRAQKARITALALIEGRA